MYKPGDIVDYTAKIGPNIHTWRFLIKKSLENEVGPDYYITDELSAPMYRNQCTDVRYYLHPKQTKLHDFGFKDDLEELLKGT